MMISKSKYRRIAAAVTVVATIGITADAFAQAYPNPYRQVDGWAKLPGGRTMGAVGGVTIDNDGRHIWAVIRCDATAPERFGNECLDSDLDSVIKFAPDGSVVESFGGGMFIWPHGIAVDPDGNVWVTDAVAEQRTPPGTRGHQVIKFSPTGDKLMTLGTPGEAGGGKDHFNAPADVVVADDGSIFIADGHGNNTNNRVVKFSADGTYVMEWGKTGYGPGEFRTLHAIAIDNDGRIFVADRSNNRVQIFDAHMNFVDDWRHFGRPSGVAILADDRLFVADSESGRIIFGEMRNPGWTNGVRFGSARDGSLQGFIDGTDPEGLAVDELGNVWAGLTSTPILQKWVKP